MRTGSIKLKHIASGLRFNSKFHLSDGEIYDRLIRSKPNVSLGSVTDKIFTSGRSKRIYTERDFGYPYLGNNEIRGTNPLAGSKFISKKYWTEKNSFLEEGMILTGRVGQDTVGSYTYASRDLNGCIGSDNVIRIVCSDAIKSGFLYAYLSSKFGYALTRRHISGAAQPFITEDMLRSLPIPIVSEHLQVEIHKLIVNATQLRMQANRLLEKVDKDFIERLNIDRDLLKRLISPREAAVANKFKTSYSSITTNTFRSRNYSKRKEVIIDILKSNTFNSLSDVLLKLPYYGSRFKRIESSSANGIQLLSQGDIFSLKPEGRLISKRNIKNFEDEIVQQGTILVPAQGTLGENEIFGRAKFVWGYLENKLIAGHAMRFIPDESKIPAGYLFAVLSSSLWFRIFRSTVYGTNLLGFIVELLKDYPVPRFDSKVESDIDANVKQAYNNLTSAITLENRAIRLIEEEIESWQN